MKKLRLVIKLLLCLSFFLPFFVLPTCSNGAKERALYIRDSLTKDSIKKDSLMKVSLEKSGKLQSYRDSIKFSETKYTSVIDSIQPHDSLTASITNTDSYILSQNKNTSISDYYSNFWKLLIQPSENTISGLGVTVIALSIPFQNHPIEVASFIFFIFSLSFIFSLITLILQFSKPCRRAHLYLSITSLFILILQGSSFKLEDFLYGYYLALIFNLSDILAIYLSLKRKSI
jgi:hypothetical protein